jgi:hypothetical protein
MRPTTTKQWIVTRTDRSFDGLEFVEATIPSVAENEVLVKFHTVALNYRDLMIPKVIMCDDPLRSLCTDGHVRENTHSTSISRSFLALMVLAK